MTTKTNKIAKLMLISGLILTGNTAFAQTQIPFPPNQYSKSYLNARGCDETVYARMYNQAATEYYAKAPAMVQTLVKTQVEAAPKEATNSMLKCVENATGQLQSAGAKAKEIYDLILGSGNIDIQALGKKAINQLSQAACTSINNYTGAAMSNTISPYHSTLTNIPGAISNAGTVNTAVGNVNIGAEVVDQMKNGKKKSGWWN